MKQSFRLTMPLFLFALATHSLSYASSPEAENEDALQKTQAMLTDPVQFQKAASETPEASAAAAQTAAIAGSQANQIELNEIASAYFGDLEKQTSGDPAKMAEIMAQYQQNPASFLENLSPEQRTKLQGLAAKIDRERKPAAIGK